MQAHSTREVNWRPMSPHALCVAPMMDWTDRHCRYFLRQVSSRAFLYTEMITTGALIHGDAERHLAFSAGEHPVGAQLGGSEPEDLARCASHGPGVRLRRSQPELRVPERARAEAARSARA